MIFDELFSILRTNYIMLSDLLKMRYTKPIYGLMEGWLWKSIAAGATFLLDLLFGIFQTNIELVALLLIAIICDWITGRIASRSKGIPIVSMGLRQTIVKILEYTVFLGIIVGISNVFGESGLEGWVGTALAFLSNIDYFAFFYAIYTELKSIQENISEDGNNNIAKIWEKLKDKINEKLQ